MKNALLRVVFALAVITAARASTTIDERRPFTTDGEVEVSITSGSVVVEAWDEPEIQVTGTIGGSAEKFEFTIENNEAIIRVINPKNGRSAGSSNIVVRMPHTCNEIRVKVTSANIDVRGIEGEIQVGAVSGDIYVIGAKGEVRAETVSGDVTIEGEISDCEAKAVSGDVTLKVVHGEVRASTISGNLKIEGSAIAQLACESLSGGVMYQGSVGKDADLELKSHSGNVTLILPPDVSAEFDVQVFSGNIRNELSDERVKRPTYGPGASLDISLNGGGASIEAESFSGNVTLKTP